MRSTLLKVGVEVGCKGEDKFLGFVALLDTRLVVVKLELNQGVIGNRVFVMIFSDSR